MSSLVEKVTNELQAFSPSEPLAESPRQFRRFESGHESGFVHSSPSIDRDEKGGELEISAELVLSEEQFNALVDRIVERLVDEIEIRIHMHDVRSDEEDGGDDGDDGVPPTIH